MKSVLVVLAVIGSVGLSGCDAGGNLGREGSLLWHNRTSAVEKAAYFGAICNSYGFKYGTPEMAQCIGEETRDSIKSAREAVAAAVAMTAAAAAAAALSKSLRSLSSAAAAAAAAALLSSTS